MSEILDLPVQHSNNAPVFVIGAGRSGTSLLCTLMRRYFKVSFGTESQFIVRMYRRLPLYGDLRLETNLHRLIDDIAKERCFERWTRRFGFILEKDRVFRKVLSGQRSYAAVLRVIFGELAHYHFMERWGDKTPEYNSDLPILLSLFPNAQFVHIVRDGRDVALSTFKMYFGSSNTYRAAVDWRKTLLRIDQFCASLSAQQALTIRYEDLLHDPLVTMDRLMAFLGIVHAEEFRHALATDIRSQIRQANCDKWLTEMSLADQRLYEAVAGEQLRGAGYPTPHGQCRRLATRERLYWEADHRLRKAFKKNYWSNTFYRTGLWLRMARESVER